MIKHKSIVRWLNFAAFFAIFFLHSFGAEAKNRVAHADFCRSLDYQKANFSRGDLIRSEIAKANWKSGLREEIADKYRLRYERWKKELLATEFGRTEWKDFAENANFSLTVKISDDEGQGAGTSEYLWDENGNLIGATIILGAKIDRGYPNPIYFPVVNSLSVKKPTHKISENILAAAKFAHEFGHVKQTAKTGAVIFRRQNELIAEYNDIFRAGNFDLQNARLVTVAENLGGTPVEIWENREYWGEANAMSFLLERIENEKLFCSVIDKIERNVKSFAGSYQDRFLEIIETSPNCRD